MSDSKAESLVRKVLGDRKNANKVARLIAMLDVSTDEETVHTVLDGMMKFLTKGFGELVTVQKKTMSEDVLSYAEWLKGQQYDFWESVIQLMDHSSVDVQVHCLSVGLQLMENEIRYHSTSDNSHFPEISVRNILQSLMDCDLSSSKDFLQTILKLADVRYFFLKLFPKSLNEALERNNGKDYVLLNAFSVLKTISESMPSDLIADESLTLAENGLVSVLPRSDDSADDCSMGCAAKPNSKALDIKELQRAFGNAWLEFLRHDLSNPLYKSVLIMLQKHLIPNFSSPCLLADFLTRSFSQGGGIALLSLHGIFVLMTEHNLEYPHFYMHLYGMIHPRIFDARYQSRFFYLLNMFLSSTHLPAYLVAAFAKKLARLALVAPTYAQQLLVNFILTLVDRHPSVEILINRKSGKQTKDSAMKSDPYIPSQTDPAQCKAMESSLWELTALKNHYLPSVATYVNEIDKGPKQDVLDQLEETYEDAFTSLCEKNFSDAPMNYRTPEGLFGDFEDSVIDLWSVKTNSYN